MLKDAKICQGEDFRIQRYVLLIVIAKSVLDVPVKKTILILSNPPG